MNPQNSNSTPVIEPGTSRHGVIIMVLSVLAFTVNTLLLRYLGEGLEKVEPYLPLFFRAVVGIFIVLVFFRGRRPTRIRPVFRDRTLILRGLCGLLERRPTTGLCRLSGQARPLCFAIPM